jgi:L-rhamnose mutarotase
MLASLKDAGISNYNIFRHGLTLFGYFETQDLAATKAKLAQSAVDRKWGEYMAPIMKIEVDPQTKFPYLLPKQFYME